MTGSVLKSHLVDERAGPCGDRGEVGRDPFNAGRPPEERSPDDADQIANLEDAQKTSPLSGEALKQSIETRFLTEAGRKEAVRVLGVEN